MRILYTLIFSFVCLFSVDAQVLIEPEALDLVMNEKSNFTYDIVVANKGNEDLLLYWRVNKSNDIPAEWKTTVCDLNLCYDENADKSFANRPNLIKKGTSSVITLKIDPNGTKGSTNLSFQLFTDEENNNLVAQTSPNSVVTADALLSTKGEGIIDELMLFPNPAENFFAIQNDKDVRWVNIYNIIGKLVRSDLHYVGQSHNISSLDKGIYLVRLLDQNKQSLKAIRLSKR